MFGEVLEIFLFFYICKFKFVSFLVSCTFVTRFGNGKYVVIIFLRKREIVSNGFLTRDDEIFISLFSYV